MTGSWSIFFFSIVSLALDTLSDESMQNGLGVIIEEIRPGVSDSRSLATTLREVIWPISRFSLYMGIERALCSCMSVAASLTVL